MALVLVEECQGAEHAPLVNAGEGDEGFEELGSGNDGAIWGHLRAGCRVGRGDRSGVHCPLDLPQLHGRPGEGKHLTAR